MIQMENKKLRIKYLYEDFFDWIWFLFKKFIEHKVISTFIIYLFGGFITSLIIGQINIWYIPMFLDTTNILNIIIFSLYWIVVIIIFIMVILWVLDILFWILKILIIPKRLIYKYFKKEDLSFTLNEFKIKKIILFIASLISFWLALFFLMNWANNKPNIDIKLSSNEKIIKWKIIYNTWDGYLLEINNKVKFIPYTKIDYLGFKDIKWE